MRPCPIAAPFLHQATCRWQARRGYTNGPKCASSQQLRGSPVAEAWGCLQLKRPKVFLKGLSYLRAASGNHCILGHGTQRGLDCCFLLTPIARTLLRDGKSPGQQPAGASLPGLRKSVYLLAP